VEAKTVMNLFELAREWKDKLCFMGHLDVRAFESGDRQRLKAEVLGKIRGMKEHRAPCIVMSAVSDAVTGPVGHLRQTCAISPGLATQPGMNRLLFGDNLAWLQDKNVFPDASVDLEYLDLPFNPNANYNVLFKSPKPCRATAPVAMIETTAGGAPALQYNQAQIIAFGDVNNQKAAGGVLITLEKPSKPMVKEAIDAGRYTAKLYQKEYPKIQILTVEGLLAGTERLEAPHQANPFAKAEREVKPEKQEEML
jgi:hypothetical protein